MQGSVARTYLGSPREGHPVVRGIPEMAIHSPASPVSGYVCVLFGFKKEEPPFGQQRNHPPKVFSLLPETLLHLPHLSERCCNLTSYLDSTSVNACSESPRGTGLLPLHLLKHLMHDESPQVYTQGICHRVLSGQWRSQVSPTPSLQDPLKTILGSTKYSNSPPGVTLGTHL